MKPAPHLLATLLLALAPGAWAQTISSTGGVSPTPGTSPWNAGAPLYIGYTSPGTLTIAGGGEVTSTEGWVSIGSLPQPQGMRQ